MLERNLGGRSKPLLTVYDINNNPYNYYPSGSYDYVAGSSPTEPYGFDNFNNAKYLTQADTGRNGETTVSLLTSNALDTYPNFNNNDGLFTPSMLELTFEAWCKFSGQSSGQYRLFGLGQYGSGKGYSYLANLYYTGGNLTFNVFPFQNTTNIQYTNYLSLGISNTNSWNHYSCNYLSGSWHYYVNGILVGSQAMTFTAQTIASVAIGRGIMNGVNDTPYTYNGNMYGIVYHPSKALRTANFSLDGL